MSRLIDRTGQRFGRLTALRRGPDTVDRRGKSRTTWVLACDCGKETTVNTHRLVTGTTQSCGCLAVEQLIERRRANAVTFKEGHLADEGADLVTLRKYRTQMHNARRRGIDWEFTYESWLAWWGSDLSRRGQGPDDLCMARPGDDGPYSPALCVKLTNRENGIDAVFTRDVRRAA